jgi:hypothetical protein
MATLLLGLACIIVLTVLALVSTSYHFRRQRTHEEALAKRVAEETVTLAVKSVRGEQWPQARS